MKVVKKEILQKLYIFIWTETKHVKKARGLKLLSTVWTSLKVDDTECYSFLLLVDRRMLYQKMQMNSMWQENLRHPLGNAGL